MSNTRINDAFCEDEIIFESSYDDFLDELRDCTENLFAMDVDNDGEKLYCLLSISKFILLKEHILPRNIGEKLVFDSIKYERYIEPLYELYDYIKEHGIVENKSNSKVEIKGQVEDQDKLLESLLTLSKIRDSLSLGYYQYDCYRRVLMINNDHSDEKEPYRLVCDIPLEILNNFTNSIRKRYGLGCKSTKIAEEVLIDNFCKILESLSPRYTKEFKERLYIDIKDFKKSHPSFTIEELDFTDSKRFKSKYKHLPEDKRKIVESFILDECNEYPELCTMLKNNSTPIYQSIISLYNYMIMTFSSNPSIEYAYMQTKGLLFKYDDAYSNKIKIELAELCREFNEKIKKELSNYDSCSTSEGKKEVATSLDAMRNTFFSASLSKFAIKNRKILDSMRNGIMNGGFEVINRDLVAISNNTASDENDAKFICFASPKALLRITDEVNDQYLPSGYKLSDFLKELKRSVKRDTYDELVRNLNRIENIIFNHDINLENPMKIMTSYDENKRMNSKIKVKSK